MPLRFLCPDCGAAQDAEYGAGGAITCQNCGHVAMPFGVAPTQRRPEIALMAELVDEAIIENPGDGLVALEEHELTTELPETIAVENRFAAARQHAQPPIREGTIGRFEIRAILGQGAFGKVYRAFDPQLDREVALKVPRIAPDDDESAERFLREAKAAARLKHPNIVAVFESGRAGDIYYIASEFVEGQPLAERIGSEKILFAQAAKIVRDVAFALEYAHSLGVVHRDLKPANVMLAFDGRPHVMDFGLAKRDDDATLTREGAILGTPAYMSPEQARGDTREVGPASDQYSLGVMLYELLCRRRPFAGAPSAVLAKVLGEDPPSPRSIDKSIPEDLEAICLKAMEKSARKRYANMLEMGLDLDRYLRFAPTLVRPQSPGERLWRFVRKRPLVSALVATVATAILVILIGGFRLNQRLGQEITEAKRLGGVADEQRRAAVASAGKAREAAAAEQLAAEKARKETERAKSETLRAERELTRAETARYAIILHLAQQHLRSGEFDQALRRLDEAPWDQRGWEHALLTTLAAARSKEIDAPVLPGPMIWNAHTMRRAHAAFSPSGDLVLLFDSAKLVCWDVASSRSLFSESFPPEYSDAIWAVAYDPSGKLFAVARSSVELRSATTGEVVATCETPLVDGEPKSPAPVAISLRFAPDGESLWAVSADLSIMQWRVPDGKALTCHDRLAREHGFTNQAAISADCRWMIADHRGEVEITTPTGHHIRDDHFEGIKGWRLSDGLKLIELPSSQFRSSAHAEVAIALSERGDYLATVQATEKNIGGVIRLWRWTDLDAPIECFGHKGNVRWLEFAAHDRLVSVGADQTIRLWDAPSGQELLTLSGLAVEAWPAGMTADGNSLIALGKQNDDYEHPDAPGAMKVWRAERGDQPLTFLGHTDYSTPTVQCVAFHPQGDRAASAGTDGYIRVWSTATGRQIKAYRDGHRDGSVRNTYAIAFSADGATLYAACAAGFFAFRLETGEAIFGRDEHFWGVTALAVDRRDKLVVTGGVDKTLLLRNAGTGKILKCFGHPDANLESIDFLSTPAHDNVITAAAFSGDGRYLASAAERLWTTGDTTPPQLKLWDVATAQQAAVWDSGSAEIVERGAVRSLAFAGELLAATGDDGQIALLEIPTLSVMRQWPGHDGGGRALAVHPGGGLLASGGKEGLVKLWKAPEGELVRTLTGHTGEVTSLAFSPDGARLASTSTDGTVKVWPFGMSEGRAGD